MDSRYEQFWPVIYDHEVGSTKDGFVDNKNDSGGVTKYGISLLFLRSENLDINGDGNINRQDILDVTKEMAKEIFYEYFYVSMRLSLIKNDSLALELLDMGVNSGGRTAIKLLQQILRVDDDGIIGYKTISAIDTYSGANLLGEYKNKRKRYYDQIIARNPKNIVFKKGWYNRVDTTFIS